mmetsp:Transcript_8704/g.35472  ORF Transcript_8704/g.35472 Transcript_8704/m.35472 type:complete len:262 (-) Transcript_8704:960-1745(-)
MHEHEELVKVVLKRRSRQKISALQRKAIEHRVQLRLRVLQPMALVHNERVNRQLANERAVLHGHLIARQKDVDLGVASVASSVIAFPAVEPLVFARRRPRLGVSCVHAEMQLRGPQFELALPVAQRRQRRHDQVGSAYTGVLESRQEDHCLNGLAEAHLVRQDPVLTTVMGKAQPVDTDRLIRMQMQVLWKEAWLLFELVEGVRALRCALSLCVCAPLQRLEGLQRLCIARLVQIGSVLPRCLVVPESLPFHEVIDAVRVP